MTLSKFAFVRDAARRRPLAVEGRMQARYNTAMSLLIDGYNLMHVAGIFAGRGPHAFAQSRLALVNFVAASVDPAELPRTIIVFDAAEAPPGLPKHLTHRGLTVRFAAQHADADALIEELIEAETAPRSLIVVSSDHRLHRAARRRKAKAVDSDTWFAELVARRRSRQASTSPRAAPTEDNDKAHAQHETEYWMNEFCNGLEAADPWDEGSIPPEWLQ